MLNIVCLQLINKCSRRSALKVKYGASQATLTRLSLPLETSQLRSRMWARLVIMEL